MAVREKRGGDPIERIAMRAARELKRGDVVNCGIGIPTRVANYVPPELEVTFQSENGIVGIGPAPPPGLADPNLTNASITPVTLVLGGAFTDSVEAFSIMRSRLDMGILGALQVDQEGNLANWVIPGQPSPGIGGAMDLAQAKRVIVTTQHRAKDGSSKLVKRCTLPLTAVRKVSRVITELAVLDVTPSGFCVKEISRETSREEVRSATDAPVTFAENLQFIEDLIGPC